MNDLSHELDLDNEDFRMAFDLLKATKANVFLTGKAGTGKSTFLKYIRDNIRKKSIVLAPTGVAAVNVGGVTIHSFFQMPLRPVPPNDPDYSVKELRQSRKFSRQKRKLIEQLELIIIDEVSMVRPDMIDFIDRALRGIRHDSGTPFGGVQLLLVGDIFQLEPVVTPDTRAILSNFYPDFYFFNARAYKSARLVSIELRKIYRQTDRAFIDMLDRIRINRPTDSDFKVLNERVLWDNPADTDDSDGFSIILASRRDTVTAINSEKMEQIPSEEFKFEGEIEADFPEKILPTDLNLVLKKDAQVMLIRNDREKRWVNGTLARISDIKSNKISVILENGKEVNVEKETWENIIYSYDEKEKKIKEEVIGRFTQYPLKSAWALTIHKSQGLTFNNVKIDMGGGAFSAGQTYVALSRCRSLEGLSLFNPLRRYDIIVSRSAAEFSRGFNDAKSTDNAFREAEAESLSQDAIHQFDAGEYESAIEKIWKIHTLTGVLTKRGVRKLFSKYLNIISDLKSELKKKDKILKKLSNEFTELGNITLNETDHIDAALGNYEKALSIWKENQDALFGKAICLCKTGQIKKGCRILDKIIKDNDRYAYRCHMLKGDILREEGDLSGAVLNYQSAAKKGGNRHDPILRIIEMYENAGMEEIADQWRDFLDSIQEA